MDLRYTCTYSRYLASENGTNKHIIASINGDAILNTHENALRAILILSQRSEYILTQRLRNTSRHKGKVFSVMLIPSVTTIMMDSMAKLMRKTINNMPYRDKCIRFEFPVLAYGAARANSVHCTFVQGINLLYIANTGTRFPFFLYFGRC
jgi:hypothetical protein